jgi:hypothetical protein
MLRRPPRVGRRDRRRVPLHRPHRPRRNRGRATAAVIDAPIELLNAVGVVLALGQRVVYATAAIHSTGQLVPGTIVSLRHAPHSGGPRERIGIRRDDGEVVYMRWSKSSSSYASSRRPMAGCAGSSLCSVRADGASLLHNRRQSSHWARPAVNIERRRE